MSEITVNALVARVYIRQYPSAGSKGSTYYNTVVPRKYG